MELDLNMNETLVFLQANKNDGKFTEIHDFLHELP